MISKYSVRKPYTVLVGVLLVIVLGIVSLSKMTTDLLPDMSLQYALVITTDLGASPEKVEKDVTAPIEAAMATTSNIKNIRSISYNSYSIVTLEYEQNANMDSVVIEIQQSLDQISGQWEDSVGTPVIMKINPDMLPVLTAEVGVDGMDESEVTDYVENELVPAIESLEGVASVTTTGELKESIKVTMNQTKIDALNQKIKKSIDAEFEKAQAEIDKGKDQLENGQSSMDTGKDQLTSAISQAMSKQEELEKTEKELRKQLKELKEQQASLIKIQDGIQSFMESEVYVGLMAMLEQNPQAAQIPEVKAQIDTLNAEIKKMFVALEPLGIKVETYEDLPNAAAEIGKLLTQVNQGIATIESALKQVEEGKITLSRALETLNANAAIAALQMSTSSAELATASSSLDTAQSSLDDAKNNAYDSADLNAILSKETLSGLFTAQNFDMPAGYAMDGDTEYLVRVGEAVKSMDDLKELVLIDMGMDDVGIIRLSDVADVEMTDNSGETYAVINGNPGIMLSMEKQTGYSTGEVTDRILEKFEKLEKADKNLHLSVLMNQGIYIDMIVKSVFQNMIFGAILAIIVLLLFLKDLKPTIIIACSIPLSVITAVVLMYFTGITMNIMSLSGLMLGIGMLVDNSIVVIENIYRLRGEGLSVKQAAVQGADQMVGALVASTLTTISVYAPIIFTEGLTRQLFVDLSLTIAFTLLASLVVALTFVPALSSATLRRTKDIHHPAFDRFKDVYAGFLEGCLRFKPIVFIVSVLLLVGSMALSLSRGLGFLDMDMETNQLSVTVAPKEGEKLTFQELRDTANDVIGKISDIEGIETIGAMAGGNSTQALMGGGNNSVSIYILLDETSDATASGVSDEILKRTEDMDCEVTSSAASMDMTAYFGSGLSVNVRGSDLSKLQSIAKDVAAILEKTEGTVDVNDGLDEATPQLEVRVDKEKAAEYNLTVAQVFQLVFAHMADSSSVTTISTDIKDYAVYLQTEEQEDTKVDDIRNLKFTYMDKEGKEKKIPLTKICKMVETTTLSTISRSAQTRYLTVSCGIDEKHNVTLVSNEVQKEIGKLKIPEGYSVEMAGEDETINDSMNQLLLMMLLAVIFIYLIMVVQFQSLASPFIIMFSIPLAFTGGFISLLITGQVLNVISMLGFIMLSGLIVNNGIVLIDYINQLRREGASKKEAIIEAGTTRMRPILMTALTTVLAMLTSAFGSDEGAKMMRPMAISIIGGLVYGTVLTLIVIPCIYDAFNREKSMVEEEL